MNTRDVYVYILYKVRPEQTTGEYRSTCVSEQITMIGIDRSGTTGQQRFHLGPAGRNRSLHSYRAYFLRAISLLGSMRNYEAISCIQGLLGRCCMYSTHPLPRRVEAGVGNLVLNQGGGSVDEHGQSRTFAVGE